MNITSFEKKYDMSIFEKRKRVISLLKKDFKVFLNCVVVVISFMLAGNVFQVFIENLHPSEKNSGRCIWLLESRNPRYPC